MNRVQARRRAAMKAERAGQLPPEQQEQELEHPLAQADADRAEPESDPFDEEAEAERAAKAEEDRQARLDAFGKALTEKRRLAIEARESSGIETIWREDEEHYEGVDDANRGEGVTLKPRDPNGLGGAAVAPTTAPGTGSTIFMPITRPYVDFSVGRAADMLLPTDDQNWDLQSTPMPDVIAAFNDQRAMPPGTPFTTVAEAAKAMVQDTKAKVEKAKKRIKDWLEEGQYNAEQRKVLLDAAKVGVGILKGPFPIKKMSRAVVKGKDGQLSIEVQNKTAPVSKRISYWNFYPAADCGDDIHKGSGVWEKDSITARELRDLLGTNDTEGKPMYLEACIKACLEEGPQRAHQEDRNYHARDNVVFPIWYYHGIATYEDLTAAGLEANPGDVLPVMVTMVNDRVIKVALSTLDSGEFPYDVMVWQPREGYWAGIGVSRQVRPAQRVLNGALRNLMDNAGIGGGPMFVYQDGVLEPSAPGDSFSVAPRKFFKVKKDAKIDDVAKAFAAIQIPMVTGDLMSIVQMALKMAEDATGIPMLMQGQQGKAADTVGGMQIVTNNSNTPMRTIAKQYDDRITEPHINRYYEWLLMYGPEQDEKGEFLIVARGSSALFERDAQNQAILQMAGLLGDPEFKINKERWFAKALEAQRLSPSDFQYTPEEWAAIEEARKNAPPPVSEKIEAATIAAKASVQREEIKAEVTKHRIDKDVDRDAVFVQEQNRRTELEHERAMAELAQRERLALLDYANRTKDTLENVKAKLADTAIKVRAQKELAAMTANGAGPSIEASTPPTEPPGKAETGEAYQA